MLSATPERNLLYVRVGLLLGWGLLALSLFWDPWTAAWTHPDNLASPFHLRVQSVIIQGQEVAQTPYAMGNRIFWTLIIPLVPLFLMLAGHEAWRRICPLSFVSQIPRLLGRQRTSGALNRRTGSIETKLWLPERNGWWRKNVLSIQFGLLFLALNIRILFINSDRTALGVFFLLVVVLVLAVGYFWGGKTWCNYLCPLSVVQKIYTGPGGLLESRPHLDKPATPQSMCRQSADGIDRSTCVGCTPNCPDVDLERSYWESLDDAKLSRIYYSFFGLIVGFYTFYYLYAGNWDYYFSGAWTHEPDPLGDLLRPGLYWAGNSVAIPKFLAVPLVLTAFVLAGVGLGMLLERLYRAACQRWVPERTAREITHHCLTVAAFVSINTFYIFGGRPNLFLLPASALRLVDVAIVLISTLWLVRAWRRSPLRYRHESVSSSLRGQLQEMKIDFVPMLDGRKVRDLSAGEVYVLAKALPVFTKQQRLLAYRAVVEDLIRTHCAESSSSQQLLQEMRQTMDVSEAEHRQLMLELGVNAISALDEQHSAVFENWLRRDNYRVACEALLLGRMEPGLTLAGVLADAAMQGPLQTLADLYQITPDEHAHVVAGIGGRVGVFYERAMEDLQTLMELAMTSASLRIATLGHSHLQVAADLLLRECLADAVPVVHRTLTTLVALGDTADTRELAGQLGSLMGADLEPMLAQPVSGGRSESWAMILPPSLLSLLKGEAPCAAVGTGGLISYRKLLANTQPMQVLLPTLVCDGSEKSALALWLLATVDSAQAARCAMGLQASATADAPADSHWMRAVKGHIAAGGAGDVAPPVVMVALRLAQCSLFSQLRLVHLTELAALATVKSWEQGQWVFQAGDPERDLLLLLSGRCIEQPSQQCFDAADAPLVLGAGSLLHAKTHTVSLQVDSERAAFIVLSGSQTAALLLRHPTMAAGVFAALAGQATSDAL